MLLSLAATQADDPVIHALRSLVARGRHAEAEQLVSTSKVRLRARQGPVFLALRAEIALGLGRFAVALDRIKQALRGLDVGDVVDRSLACLRIRALIGLGRFREAQGALHDWCAPGAPGDAEWSLLEAHIALGSGRLAEATRAATEACSAAISSRQRLFLIGALRVRARAERDAGDVKEARSDLERAQRLCEGLRDTSALAHVLSDSADLLAHSGEWTEAMKSATRSGRLFARTFSPDEHLSAGRRSGLLGLAQGEPHAALPFIEKAAAVARRGFGTAEGRAEIDLLLADAHLAGRDPESALDRATAALSFFRNAQDQGGLARAHVRRSLAALSASNLPLAFREARIAGTIQDAGPVAEGLSDLALGWVLLRREPTSAAGPFDRAAQNRGLYPPLRFVATLGTALSHGASHQSDAVRESMARIEAFGDRRISSIARSGLLEVFGIEFGQEGSLAIVVDPDGVGADPDGCEDSVEFLPGLIGVSAAVRDLSGLVRKAARSDLHVSIYGETGTGKEQVAKAIHDFSSRSTRKFVVINAASFSDELFASELFGHARGSFTGAHTDRPGVVEEAKGGTLFIDEVADLSPRSQTRLLRFLEDGKYRRVGENQERQADVRIVVAANQSLAELVRAERFREDLLHRLQGMEITVPPLRERGRDIIRLAQHFVAGASESRARLTPEAESDLTAYSWPGNVRELKQAMRRAVVLSDSPRIEWRRPRVQTAEPVEPAKKTDGTRGALPLHEAVRGYERSLIKSALSLCAERVEAARQLGISRQALHQKIIRYGL